MIGLERIGRNWEVRGENKGRGTWEDKHEDWLRYRMRGEGR
jgi:hypothetical protein